MLESTVRRETELIVVIRFWYTKDLKYVVCPDRNRRAHSAEREVG